MNPITSLILLAVTSGHSVNPAPPILTVCEAVRNLRTLRNRTVIAVGVYFWTFEGGFLSEQCPERNGQTSLKKEQVIQLRTGSGQGTLPTRFEWNRDLLQAKLRQAQTCTKLPPPDPLSDARWMAVRGTLQGPGVFRPPKKIADTVRPGNGYGVNGSVPARLLSADGGEYVFPAGSANLQ